MPIRSILLDSFDTEYELDNLDKINDRDTIIYNMIETIAGVYCKRRLAVSYVLISNNTDLWGRAKSSELINVDNVCLSQELFKMYLKSERFIIERKNNKMHVRVFLSDKILNCEIKPLNKIDKCKYLLLNNDDERYVFLEKIESLRVDL